MPNAPKIAAPLRSLLVPIARLSPDAANLRVHDDRSIAAIRASLRRFGQVKPIVIDAGGVVIAGNGTLAAAKAEGWTYIAAVRTKMQGVERVAYAIADNRTAELSKWDAPALGRTLEEIPADIRAELAFDGAELAALNGGDEAEVKEVPAPAPVAPAVTKPGDLWHLGEHRLLCGDSTKPADVLRVMGTDRAVLVATDPPYLVDYTGERLGDNGKDWSGVYHEVRVKDARSFYRALYEVILKIIAPNAALYCWHAHKRVGVIQAVWSELGILDHQQIIWVKPTAVIGHCYYHFQHEPCMLGWKEKSKPRHNGKHDLTSVWTVPGSQVQVNEGADVWICDWEGKNRVVGNEHPTQKPVEIFARPMRMHTAAGDIVFEPFSGSGTQLIAAEQLGRRCRAIELEPVFVDVAIRRWQTLTGQRATLEDGTPWGAERRQPKARPTSRRKPRAFTSSSPAARSRRGR